MKYPLRSLSKIIALILWSLAIFTLFLYLYDFTLYKNMFSGLIIMKPNTVLCFLLSGISLWLLNNEKSNVLQKTIVLFFSISVLLIGLFTLIEIAFAINLKIDGLFSIGGESSTEIQNLGRMSSITAMFFFLVGIVFLSLYFRWKHYKVIQILILLIFTISLLAYSGYLYGDMTFYNIKSQTTFALHTALSMILLTVGLLAAIEEKGIIPLFTSNSSGGKIVRKFLPIIIILPFFLGWLRFQGGKFKLYDTVFGFRLFVVSIIIVLILIVIQIGLHLMEEEKNIDLLNKEKEKRAEELENTYKKITDYKYALDESSIVALIDKEGSIIHINDYFCEISKYSREELLGKNYPFLNAAYYTHEFLEKLWITLGKGEIWEGEFKNKAKDGSVYWLDTTIIPFLDKQNEPYQYIAIHFDVTERKKAKEKLKKHLQVLKSQNTQLTDFCYIISHNLRGPLVNIFMLIDYIENTQDESEKKEMFQKIRPVANTINETLDELVESLQVKFDFEIKSESITLDDCIKKTIKTLEFEISESKAKIEIDINTEPIIYFPEKYLENTLFNLISNTLKYKSPDRLPNIKIKTERKKNNIILSVSDNGLGLDLKMHGHNLFKIRKVFHIHPDSRGFGLFMIKTQIEAMGGKIWAESVPDEGTTFFVEFIKQNR